MADMNQMIDNVVVAAVEPVKKGFFEKAKEVAKEWAPAAGLAAGSATVGYVLGKNHVIGKAVNAVTTSVGKLFGGKKESVEVQQPVAQAAEEIVDDVKPEETQK